MISKDTKSELVSKDTMPTNEQLQMALDLFRAPASGDTKLMPDNFFKWSEDNAKQ